jgi:hypothetical protein
MTLQKSFKSYFATMTKEELVDRFNHEVGNKGWVSARAIYLSELRSAMINIGLDLSAVTNESGGFNLDRHIEVRDDTVVIIS